MGHSLRPDNLTITPDFVIADGTHNSGYVLVSDTGGVTSWKNSDNIPGFKTAHYVGELWAGGVVAAVWKENDVEKCLIVALCDFSYTTYDPSDTTYPTTQFIWSDISATGSATSSYDGLVNSNYITSQSSSTSTGAYICLNYTNPDYGTGTFSNWYLPSVTEMQQVANNSLKINSAINKYATYNSKSIQPWDNSNQYVSYISKYEPANSLFNPLILNFNYYWTSTEVMNANGTSAYAISILNNTPQIIHKDSANTIRPVRVVSETVIKTNSISQSSGVPSYNIYLYATISGSGDLIVEIGSCWNGPYLASAGYGVGPDKLSIPLPTISNNKVVSTMIYDPNIGFGYGDLTSYVNPPFQLGNLYSIRPYVITSKGDVKYGDQIVFPQ